MMLRQFRDTSVHIDREASGAAPVGCAGLSSRRWRTGSSLRRGRCRGGGRRSRFAHEGHRYAIYRSPEDGFYATDGVCTHEHTLLADGLVMGHIIECPKHNGRFDYRTGEGKSAPITSTSSPIRSRSRAESVYVDVG